MLDKKYLTKPPKLHSIILRCIVYVMISYYVSFEFYIKVVCAFIYLALELYFISVSWTYPELDDNHLVIRNLLFRFYSQKYKYHDIQFVEIGGSHVHYPLITIKLRGKRTKRYHSMDCMDCRSVTGFIADLQLRGVDVICK